MKTFESKNGHQAHGHMAYTKGLLYMFAPPFQKYSTIKGEKFRILIQCPLPFQVLSRMVKLSKSNYKNALLCPKAVQPTSNEYISTPWKQSRVISGSVYVSSLCF